MKNALKVFFAFILFSAIGLYIIYINLFPKAESIILPKIKDINIIVMEKGNKVVEYNNEKEIVKILELLSSSKATRITSTSERPIIDEYILVDFATNTELEYKFFIYFKNKSYFVEQPYHGIYEIDRKNLEVLPFVQLLNK